MEEIILRHGVNAYYFKEVDGLPTEIHWKGVKRTLEKVILVLLDNAGWNEDNASKAFLEAILDKIGTTVPVEME